VTAIGYALFDTAIGRCGISWSEQGIVAVQLPERDDERTRARLRNRSRGAAQTAPPPGIRQVIDEITRLVRGEPVDLASAVLDSEGVPAFHQRVYEITRTIPPGATLTYGEIATRLNDPGAARAVGQALGSNPFPIIVPCHRVLAANGQLGGFSANGGRATKRRLLEIEGALLDLQGDLRGPNAYN
jgi:methylated-DNA-[protein]-cysteine S-methyltransferase